MPGFTSACWRSSTPSAIRPLRVVLDGCNGMAGPVIGPVLERLPVQTSAHNFEPDGHFPNHEPNPLIEENRRFIIDQVRSEGADLGIAWDGDADRCFFIDDTGEFVPGDLITALIAEPMLERHPGATIVYDLRASWAVRDVVRAAGGTALENRVGHAFIKRRMRKEDAVFAGEVSGHYYFRDFYYCDTGVVPALVMLELVSRAGQAALGAAAAVPRALLHLGRDQLDGVRRPAQAAAAQGALRPGGRPGVAPGRDLVRVPDWHFNVRPSNTEPLLRLNLEALDADTMQRRLDEVLALIRADGVPPPTAARRSASPTAPAWASTRPTRRASSTTAATCPTSTAPGSSICARSASSATSPGEPEFVMRAQHVEYHAPARFDDELEVFVRVDRLGQTSIRWAFDAYRVATGEHLASATQTWSRSTRPSGGRCRSPRLRAAVVEVRAGGAG